MLQRLKVVLGGAGIGATLALIAALFLGPRFVAWRWEPHEHQQLSCAPEVRAALDLLITIELWTAGIGAAFGIVFALLIGRRSSAPKLAETSPASVAPGGPGKPPAPR
jgi:hypothetical protein